MQITVQDCINILRALRSGKDRRKATEAIHMLEKFSLGSYVEVSSEQDLIRLKEAHYKGDVLELTF